MSRAWNGESLVNELSALLGDTSAVFKVRVLGWLNDTIFDIGTRHDWGNHLVKGKKNLSQDSEHHNLEVAPPCAPGIALKASGSLPANTKFQVQITFVQGNGTESLPGNASIQVTTTEESKTLRLGNIATSKESLVAKRNIYLKKDDGNFYFHSQINDNFTIDYEITEENDSVIEPPDCETVRRLNGSPFFESGPSNYLEYRDVDQLRKLAQGSWSRGNPSFFSPLAPNMIATYPVPSIDMELSFNYYRYPFKLYATKDSQPDLSISLKPALKAGVIALGYEYRDRAGQELKRANYENALMDAINRGGRVANIEYSVKDVYGNFDGTEVN